MDTKMAASPRKALPDQALLLELLSYDPCTGALTWKPRSQDLAERFGFTKQSVAMWNGLHAGERAEASLRNGYVGVTIFNQHYFAHRIIWKMVHGHDPDHIDHISGEKSDNRLCNLRDVTATENQRNRKLNSNNSSGHAGVYWCRTNKKWAAKIRVSGVHRLLGRFADLDDAIAARNAAELAHNFHENHGAHRA
jgi:hypothetical protein